MTNEEAIKIFKEVREEVIAKETELSRQVFENLGIKAIDLAIKALEQARPKGVWLKRDYWSEGVGMGETYGYYYQCSECKKMVKGGYISCDDKFCSNCGADMRGDSE